MKLSFAIPTYNRANLLKETIENIAEQIGNDENIDVVISDNASTDNTENVVKELQLKYPYIKYFRNKTNLGMDRNFDNAVIKATGEYVWLFGDDDVLNPGALKKVIEVFKNNTNLALVYVDYLNLIPHDCVIEDPNQFLQIVKTRITFITSLIFEKKLWTAIEKEKFYDTQFVHVYVILSFMPMAMPEKKIYFISGNYVSYIHASLVEEHWSSQAEIALSWAYNNLPKIYEYFKNYKSYNNSLLEKIIKDYLLGLPRTLMRLIAINALERDKLYRLKETYYYYNLTWVWLFSILISYTPKILAKFIWFLWKLKKVKKI